MEPNQRVLLQPRLQHYVTLHGDTGIDIIFVDLEFKRSYTRMLKRVKWFECTCTYSSDTHSWIPATKKVEVNFGYDRDMQPDITIIYDKETNTYIEYIPDTNCEWTHGSVKTTGSIYSDLHDIDNLYSNPMKENIKSLRPIDAFKYKFCDCPSEKLQIDLNTNVKTVDTKKNIDNAKNEYLTKTLPKGLVNPNRKTVPVVLYNIATYGRCDYEHLTLTTVTDKLLPYDVPDKYDTIKTITETYNPDTVTTTYTRNPSRYLKTTSDGDEVDWTQFINNKKQYFSSRFTNGVNNHGAGKDYRIWNVNSMHNQWNYAKVSISKPIVTEIPEIPEPITESVATNTEMLEPFTISEPLATEVPEISDIELMRKIINQQ